MTEIVKLWEAYPFQGWLIFFCLLGLAFNFAGKRR